MINSDSFPILTILSVIIVLAFLAFGVLGFIFWLLMLIDCAKRNFGENQESEKIVWILIVIFTNWLGAILYYFIIKRPSKIMFKQAQEQVDLKN